MFYTYILYSNAKDRFYTGYTSNLPQTRLDQHNNAMSPSTTPGIPWKLMFFKSFESKSGAIRFEKYIKQQKSGANLILSDENECGE